MSAGIKLPLRAGHSTIEGATHHAGAWGDVNADTGIVNPSALPTPAAEGLGTVGVVLPAASETPVPILSGGGELVGGNTGLAVPTGGVLIGYRGFRVPGPGAVYYAGHNFIIDAGVDRSLATGVAGIILQTTATLENDGVVSTYPTNFQTTPPGAVAFQNGGVFINFGSVTGAVASNNASELDVTNGSPSYTSATMTGVYGTTLGVNIGSITNFGTISTSDASASAVTITEGSVTNGAPPPKPSPIPAAATISGGNGVELGTGTLINYGNIKGRTRSGVEGSNGSSVTNGSQGDKNATISGVYAGVSVGPQGSIINFGTITGSGNWGASAGAGGMIVNGALADTTAYVAGGSFGVRNGSELQNFGTIAETTAQAGPQGGAGVYNGGSFINGVKGKNIGVVTAVGDGVQGTQTITNYGQIISSGTASYGIEIPDGTISNFGTIAAAAGQAGIGTEAYSNYIAAVSNGKGALIEGGQYGIRLDDANLTNSGTILGVNSNSDGVNITGICSLVNKVGGTISGGSYGLWGGNDPAISFSNYGLIEGKVGVGKMTSPFTNGGTIASTLLAAGTAVSSYAPITLLPGATFIGHVYEFTDRFGNHGLLNLGGSGATGTLSGVGTVFQNIGTLDVLPGASWLLKGPNGISNFATVEGTLNVTGSLGEPSAMQVSGSLITSGTIASSSGPAVTLAAGSAIELLPGAAFTGAVQGAGSATLDLGAGNIPGSIADFGTAFTGFTEIDVAGQWGLTGTSGPASGLVIGGSGTLQVQGTMAVPGTLLLHGADLAVSPAGTVEVGSAGGATAGRITVDHFSLLAGYGTLKAQVSDSGTVEATGGTLSLAANVSGKGTIAIDTGSVLNAAGLLGKAAVVFVNGGSNESLIAANPHAIGGLISGFAASDTIDLSGFAETGWSFKGSTLTLNGAGGAVALHFAAGITAADFNIGSDGGHGTAILHT